jgi:uncharacterized protein YyaL (SSP411 family)
MIAALALGSRVLQNPDYAARARRAADFILNDMRDRDGRLRHRFRDGEAAIPAQAADYAFFIYGLLHLYRSTFDVSCAETALALQEIMIDEFWDSGDGGFFLTGTADGDLPVRPKELYDGAIPSANSVALYNLLQLSRLTGNSRWEARAQELVRSVAGTVTAQPAAFTFFLMGLDFALHPGADIVIAGQPDVADTQRLLEVLARTYSPHQVALLKSERNADRLSRFAGYTDGLQVVEGKAVAHICRNGGCRESTSDIETMLAQLRRKK